MEIGVAYLARAAEPEEKISSFISSYQKHGAGISHRLIVLYKGGPKHSTLFAGIPHEAINLPDTGLDITAYLSLARICEHRLLCFINSNTQIRSDGWLKKLTEALSGRNVGMVGATGSYESLATSLELMHKVGWLAVKGKIPFNEAFAKHYEWLLVQLAPSWLKTTQQPSLKSLIRGATHPYRWKLRWLTQQQDGTDLCYLKEHSRFPNPHIRSNVFLIDRESLLDVSPEPIISKEEAYGFESGKDSLSRRLIRKSLRLLVVSADGHSFDIPDWASSQTYRIANQENLLASDNQTERFELSDQYERGILTMLSWGLDAVVSPKPPHLGLRELTKNIASVRGFLTEQKPLKPLI